MVASEERDFWNEWNATHRESTQGDVSLRQAEVVNDWLAGHSHLSILDAGCGTGWLCERLQPFGAVTGTDLADEVVEQARQRVPKARFVAGDIMTVDVGRGFDVVTSLEVLSHVADQPAFMRRMFELIRPGGQLILATQNRPVLERFNRISPPAPGQLRRWVDRKELEELLTDAGFEIDRIKTLTPKADRHHRIMWLIAKVGTKTRTTPVLERLGFGWTLMVNATKPG